MAESEEIVVNVTSTEIRVAILENKLLQEVYIERFNHKSLVGNIYKGKITRLIPGIQAAFVDIGLEKSAFLPIRTSLKVGQELLVQVDKDPVGSKGVKVTTVLSIPGRYLVFTPGVFQVSVSQKIKNLLERERLQSLITTDEKGGYIVRTVAEGISQEELEADKKYLSDLWNQVQISEKKVASMVHEEIPLFLRVLRDLMTSKMARIQVDDQNVVLQMQDFAKKYFPNAVINIEHYKQGLPIFDLYGVESEIQNALQRKVSLKSGGYVVFDQTEALTTIDVNTGSFIGNHDSLQTIFKTNLEAVNTIARQLRLRNIGGIIIIDFIDLQDEAHQKQLIQAFSKAVEKDNIRIDSNHLSHLGLLQITRKRTRESLEQILCITCPTCHRKGTIKSYATLAGDIFRDLQRSALLFNWPGFLVLASEDMINYLSSAESMRLKEWESYLGKPIKLQNEMTYTYEQFDILPLEA